MLQGLVSIPKVTMDVLFTLKPLDFSGPVSHQRKGSCVYLYLRGMRKSIKGKCFSHKSLLTTGWDHYLIIIVASLHCSPSCPPHLFSLIVRSASLHFPAFMETSRCCLFFRGGKLQYKWCAIIFFKTPFSHANYNCRNLGEHN